MTPFRLDNAERFADVLRRPPADAVAVRARLRELMRDCLPPFHQPPTVGGKVDGTEWLLDRIADAVRVEAGTLGAVLAGRSSLSRTSLSSEFANRYRASCFLWAFGFRPSGELASVADPDLGEVAAELQRAHGGPTARFNLRSLIGTALLLQTVIRHLGPVRVMGGERRRPLQHCTARAIDSPVSVPRENTIRLNAGYKLGGAKRLGGVATVTNARVRITLTADARYFDRDLAKALDDWATALAAAEWWAVRLVPAGMTVEWERVVNRDGAHRLAELSRPAFALNRGLRLKPR